MNGQISINSDTCIGCGLCSKVCTKKILRMNEKKVNILKFDDWKCCSCGLCMSVCPTKSIQIEGLDYKDFSDLHKSNIDFSDLETMLSARRSIRNFLDKPIKRGIINKVIKVSAMAPIGAPPTNVKVLIIDNQSSLDALYKSTNHEWKKLLKSMKNPIYRIISKKVAGAIKYNALISHALPAARLYCKDADEGKNVFTFNASAIILFYGDKLGVCMTENCWLSSSFAIIAAHAQGLGAILSGMIPPIINMNKEVKKQLGISENDDVYSCLMLGHPDNRVKFKRKIPREQKQINFAV